jgi:hypothetical protein
MLFTLSNLQHISIWFQAIRLRGHSETLWILSNASRVYDTIFLEVIIFSLVFTYKNNKINLKKQKSNQN